LGDKVRLLSNGVKYLGRYKAGMRDAAGARHAPEGRAYKGAL